MVSPETTLCYPGSGTVLSPQEATPCHPLLPQAALGLKITVPGRQEGQSGSKTRWCCAGCPGAPSRAAGDLGIYGPLEERLLQTCTVPSWL